jgi:hypothetical protein
VHPKLLYSTVSNLPPKKHRPSTRFSPLAGQYFERIKGDQPHKTELRNPLPNRDLSQPQNLTLKQSSQPGANAYSHLTLPHLNCCTLKEIQRRKSTQSTYYHMPARNANAKLLLLSFTTRSATPEHPPLPHTALKFSKKGLVLSKDPKRVLNEMLITKKKGEKGAETGQERSRRAMAGGEVAKRCCCSFPCHRQRSLPETSSTKCVHSGHKCAPLVHIRVVRGQRALIRGSRMWISYPRTY